MKNHILSSLFVLTFLFSNGQITFEKTFGGDGDDYGTSVIQTLDGGYMIAGSYNNSKHTIIKTDSLGEIEWTKSYLFLDSLTSFYSFKSIIQTSNSNYVLIGPLNNGSFLLKLNSNGDVLNFYEEIEFFDVSPSFSQLIEDLEGHIIIVGSYNFIDSWECCDPLFWKILEMNNNSLTISTPNFNYCFGDFGCSLSNIIIDNEGNFLTTGNSFWPESKPLLVKFSPSMDILFSSDYSFPFIASSMTQEQDGSYLIVGDNYDDNSDSTDVFKTDNDGNLLWRKKYKEDENGWHSSYIDTTHDGYLISGGDLDFNLMKIDSDYNLIWSIKYGGEEQDEIFEMKATRDGGSIMIGSTKSYGNGGKDIYFIKTNAQGLVTGINELEETNLFISFPNPFSKKTFVKSNVYLKNATLLVFNTRGQIVSLLTNINGYSFEFVRGDIPEDIYFFRLHADNEFIGSGKFIIINSE